MSRIKDLEPGEPARRYERSRPGEMLHIDIKKLGRFDVPGHRATGTRQNCRNQGAGWDFVHVAIDDHSRIAFSQIRADERASSAGARSSRHGRRPAKSDRALPEWVARRSGVSRSGRGRGRYPARAADQADQPACWATPGGWRAVRGESSPKRRAISACRSGWLPLTNRK